MALADQIAALEAILDVGVQTVTVDGRTVTYDFQAIGRRLGQLRRQLTDTNRPRVASIDLSRF